MENDNVIQKDHGDYQLVIRESVIHLAGLYWKQKHQSIGLAEEKYALPSLEAALEKIEPGIVARIQKQFSDNEEIGDNHDRSI